MQEQDFAVSSDEEAKLRKTGYILVGKHKHSAVKICHYTKQSMTDEGVCYKQKFYGIASHRCMQFTPSLPFCTQGCNFCWRDTNKFTAEWRGTPDEPRELVEEGVMAQVKLLNGFKGNPKANQEKYVESREPVHVAISLDGEPTLYPRLPELITHMHHHGMTTFLVTNGTNPDALRALRDADALPTQLYVSTCAFDEFSYHSTLQPKIANGWEKLNETLELLPELKTRKVLRLTLVRDYNFAFPEKYAELVKKAKPHFVECKAYMNVGYSVNRLTRDNMPTHTEILDFSKKLAEYAGYVYADDQEISRVALLCRDETVNANRRELYDKSKWVE